jgi:hypothetical protein
MDVDGAQVYMVIIDLADYHQVHFLCINIAAGALVNTVAHNIYLPEYSSNFLKGLALCVEMLVKIPGALSLKYRVGSDQGKPEVKGIVLISEHV